MKKLLESLGIKRYLATVISGITAVVAGIPALAFLIPILTAASAALGITGVANATVSGTIKQYKLNSIASIVAVLILVCHQVPSLAIYLPVLQAIAALLGGSAVAKGLVEKNAVKK